MDKTSTRFAKYLSYEIPQDPYFDQRDDEDYIKLTRELRNKFQQILSSYTNTHPHLKYFIKADIDSDDSELSFLEYTVECVGYVPDNSVINHNKIKFDLYVICVIMNLIAQMNNYSIGD